MPWADIGQCTGDDLDPDQGTTASLDNLESKRSEESNGLRGYMVCLLTVEFVLFFLPKLVSVIMKNSLSKKNPNDCSLDLSNVFPNTFS